MHDSLAFQLAVPMAPDMARQRQVPPGTSYLLLSSLADKHRIDEPLAEALADALLQWARPGETPFAWLWVPYMSDRKLRRVLEQGGLLDAAFVEHGDWVIPCSSRAAVKTVLTTCRCEITGFVFCDGPERVRETVVFANESKWNYESFESNLLNLCGRVHGGFAFAASGHASLEVLGSPDFIVERCLRWIAQRWLEAP